MSIAAKAARGAVWTILSSVGGRAIGVIGTLVITRFLAPAQLGEVGVAAIIVTSVNWLTTLGFGQYVIVRGRKEPGPEVVWHATVASYVLGVIGLGLVARFAGPVAGLVRSEQAALYIPGLALAIGIRRASAIAEKVLVRQLKFRAIGLTLTLGELAFAITTIGFATHGYGGMSVVWGNIAQYSIVSLIIFVAAGWRSWATPTPLSWTRFRDMLDFGAPLAMESIAHNAARYWDNLAIRRLFGDAPTGLYNLAYNLADVPAVHIGEQIGSVLLPSLASLPPERRAPAFERATALLALIIFPLACGLGAVSNTLVRLTLSDEWQDVAPLLTVLAMLSVFRPIGWVVSSYLQSQERNRPLMFLELGKVIVLLGGIYALSPFGIRASACAVGLAFGLHTLAGVMLVVRSGPRPRVLFSGFVRPLIAAGAMSSAVLAIRFTARQYGLEHPGILLAVEIVVGVAIYVPVAYVVCNRTARDLLSLVKQVVRRRRGGASDEDD